MHKGPDFLQGQAGLGEPGRQGMKYMGHTIPDLQLAIRARFFCLLGNAHRIAVKQFVAAHLHQQRWQAGEVGKDR